MKSADKKKIVEIARDLDTSAFILNQQERSLVSKPDTHAAYRAMRDAVIKLQLIAGIKVSQ